MRDPLRIILRALALAAAGLTVLGIGGRFALSGRVGWVLDLLSHWPKHVFLLAVIVAAIAGWRRLQATAGLAAAAAAINLTLVLGLGGFALPQSAPADMRRLRVVSANVQGSMEALEKLAVQARAYGADAVAIYESPETLTLDDVAGLFPDLPGRVMPGLGQQGLKLNRRSMLAVRAATDIDVTTFPLSHGVILRAPLGEVMIVTTHPPSPVEHWLRDDRDEQLARVASGLDVTQPFVIMGDFNSTPWGHAYGAVPGTRAGDPRFEGTFPASAGWFGLPIDHVKFGGGLVLTDFRTGENIGSDHRPLFATFALPPA